jgi:hypothetical protein
LKLSNERFLLFKTQTLSVDIFTFVKENFPFQNKNELVDVASHLMFDIGRAFGSTSIKDAEEKIRVCSQLLIETINLLLCIHLSPNLKK